MQIAKRQWLGIALIVLGALFLLDALRFADFGELFRSYWPVLIILWGILVLLRRTPATGATSERSENTGVFGDINVSTPDDSVQQSSVFGDVSMRVTSQSFRGGRVSTVFGDTTIDLSACGLADGEQVLHVSGVFGDCTVRIPKGTAYAVSSHSVFGSVTTPDQRREGFSPTVVQESPGYGGGAKKLRINLSQVFGDIRVEG